MKFPGDKAIQQLWHNQGVIYVHHPQRDAPCLSLEILGPVPQSLHMPLMALGFSPSKRRYRLRHQTKALQFLSIYGPGHHQYEPAYDFLTKKTKTYSGTPRNKYTADDHKYLQITAHYITKAHRP